MEPTFYHYFNRGVNKAKIFFAVENHQYLVNNFYRFLPFYKINLVAYCLMPNHYHLLLEVFETNHGPRYVQRVFNEYTQAINKRYNRVGTLFQGSVKKKEVEDNESMAILISYIHLNPITAGLVKNVADWKYSDYRDWAGVRKTPRKIEGYRSRYFGSVQDFVEVIDDRRILLQTLENGER